MLPDPLPLLPSVPRGTRPAKPAPDTAAPANLGAPTAPLRPFAGRAQSAHAGLRVLPLDGFHWGGGPRPGMPRTARVRGDHCLVRIASGTLRLVVPGRAEDHGPGSVVFVPAGTAFGTLPLAGAEGQVLLVPRPVAAQLRLSLPDRVVRGADAAGRLVPDLEALAAPPAQPPAATAGATAAARVELIFAALQGLDAALPSEPAARPGSETRALVGAFVELAGREMGRGRTLSDLAEALGTNAAGLDGACRTQRGCTALELMYQLRLDRARALLADQALSLVQIAQTLGFTGAAHLNRAFMAATGRPAEAFRPG